VYSIRVGREYFTVKLSGVEVDVSTRIRLETRFAELVERFLNGHEATLLACKGAAADPQDAAMLRDACARARAAMLESEELPSCGRFSVRLSQVFDL
jgi:hypothetical protein